VARRFKYRCGSFRLASACLRSEPCSGAVHVSATDRHRHSPLHRHRRFDSPAPAARRALRTAFEDHGGHEIDTQGDSFFATFARAADAVRAAMAAQRALAKRPWPEGVTLRAGPQRVPPRVAPTKLLALFDADHAFGAGWPEVWRRAPRRLPTGSPRRRLLSTPEEWSRSPERAEYPVLRWCLLCS